jgi:hypothetical protein
MHLGLHNVVNVEAQDAKNTQRISVFRGNTNEILEPQAVPK